MGRTRHGNDLNVSDKLSKVKGTNDFLPDEARKFLYVEDIIHAIMSSYGYGFIKTPTFEKTDLLIIVRFS